MKKAIAAIGLLAFASALLAGCEPGDAGSSQVSRPVTSSESSSVEGGGAGDTTYEDFVFDGIVRIYYHRDDGDYANKRLWVWGVGVDGSAFQDISFDNISEPDEFGVYYDVDMQEAPWNAISHSSISFIVKEAGTWNGQSTDTICPFGKFKDNVETDGNGREVLTIYAIDNGDMTVGTYAVRAQALGDRIGKAEFVSWNQIRVIGTGTDDGRDEESIGKVSHYDLYAFTHDYYLLSEAAKAQAKPDYLVASGDPASNDFTIDLPEDIIPSVGYTVEATFANDESLKKSKAVSCVRLYDTDEFNANYVYDGHDLGCHLDESGDIVFKLWAPTAYRVQLYVYTLGTPSALSQFGDSPMNNLHTSWDLRLGERGVWSISASEIIAEGGVMKEGRFYSYAVTNSEGTVETSDPYGVSFGINGERSAVMTKKTLDKIEPEGFDESISALTANYPIEALNDLFIYEAHVRDVTADETWISNEGNPRGTFLAMAERGTTYTEGGVTVSTGLDSILELGVNAIQLLPVFDGDNDERPVEGSEFNGDYNWGYNPLNYNGVEGAYSTDPYSEEAKITEFKTLIKTLADNGVRTIMDVVYNHTSSISGASFNKIMPKYYFRTDLETGTYFNGSGTGNVTASERPMVRNFIVDSVSYWASEFGIKGFRFDLMGCLDLETMKAVRRALDAIDPTIAVYGEGWNGAFGGPSGIDDKLVALTGNVYSQLYGGAEGLEGSWGIGAFNDHGRDGLKGNTQWEGAAPDYGFISQDANYLSADKRTDAAASFLGANEGVGSNPTQTINYASCHDNYTLYDQMNYCLGSGLASSEDSQVARDATIAVTAAIVYSQGAAFVHGGEEIFRQKVMRPGDPYWDLVDQNAASNDAVELGDGTRLMRNSYTYGDAVNSYKYDRKVAFLDDYNRYKEACLLRSEGMEGGYLGRPYDDATWGASGCSLWGDYQDAGRTRTVAAANFAGLDGNPDRYVALGGCDPDDELRKLSFGANRVKVVYSSSGYHEAGQEITTSDFLQLGKYEMLILEKI